MLNNVTMAASSPHATSAGGHPFELTEQKSSAIVMDSHEKMSTDDEVDSDPAFEGTKSAPEDKMAMERMGKKQQLIVCLLSFETWIFDSPFR